MQLIFIKLSILTNSDLIKGSVLFMLQDIPSLTAEAAKEHPGVSYMITAPLGLHELLVVSRISSLFPVNFTYVHIAETLSEFIYITCTYRDQSDLRSVCPWEFYWMFCLQSLMPFSSEFTACTLPSIGCTYDCYIIF